MTKNDGFQPAVAPAIKHAADRGIDTTTRQFAEDLVDIFYPEAEGQERELVVQETMATAKAQSRE